MKPFSYLLWNGALIVLVALTVTTFSEYAVGAKQESSVFVWSGRWEDGTGYFVDIRQCENGYKLFRSGNDLSGLKFVGMTERRFIYRESAPSYIHILKYESKDRIQDVWIDIEKNEVWNVGILHRKKDSSEDIVSVVPEVGRGGKGGLFHWRKTRNRRKNHPKIILGRRNK